MRSVTEEAADDVDRAEGDRDHDEDVLEHAVGRADHQQAAEQARSRGSRWCRSSAACAACSGPWR
jgi:hypothetical protein